MRKNKLSVPGVFGLGLLLLCPAGCGKQDSAKKESAGTKGQAGISINERPMFGNLPKNEQQQAADEKFIDAAIKSAGSREKATWAIIQLGWESFYKGDHQTAMKRFNQAWLLDKNNAEVYYGFGFLMSARDNPGEAIPLYKKALELNPDYAMAWANLARSAEMEAYNREDEEEATKLLAQALALYEKAGKKAASNNERSYIYYHWAMALKEAGNYSGAWAKIKLCRKYGGAGNIQPDFISELSEQMPEPKS